MCWQPDLVYFNFGMHDYVTNCEPGYGCVPGQSGNATVYPKELRLITERLITYTAALSPPAKLMFAITSPYLCDASIDNVIAGTLNVAAKEIMTDLKVPTIDLHAAVTSWCGDAPQSSCLGQAGCFCPHCPGIGYQKLANTTIAPAIRAALLSR